MKNNSLESINPIEIFGEGLVPLMRDMLREAKKAEKSIAAQMERATKIHKKYGCPDWMIYHYCHHSGLLYEEHMNARAQESMASWYAKQEKILENQDWEDDYDHAKQVRIESVVRDLYPDGRLKKARCCPFHKERTPSFHIYPNTNSWFCFGCNKGGSPIDYIMEKHNLTFKEAVKFLKYT